MIVLQLFFILLAVALRILRWLPLKAKLALLVFGLGYWAYASVTETAPSQQTHRAEVATRGHGSVRPPAPVRRAPAETITVAWLDE